MRCDYCKGEFVARGQSSVQRFCPGGECRKAFYREARRLGAEALRQRGAKPISTKQCASQPSHIQRMEAEAVAAGTPGMFARPGSKSAPDLRMTLGRAALKLGLLAAVPGNTADQRSALSSPAVDTENIFSIPQDKPLDRDNDPFPHVY